MTINNELIGIELVSKHNIVFCLLFLIVTERI